MHAKRPRAQLEQERRLARRHPRQQRGVALLSLDWIHAAFGQLLEYVDGGGDAQGRWMALSSTFGWASEESKLLTVVVEHVHDLDEEDDGVWIGIQYSTCYR